MARVGSSKANINIISQSRQIIIQTQSKTLFTHTISKPKQHFNLFLKNENKWNISNLFSGKTETFLWEPPRKKFFATANSTVSEIFKVKDKDLRKALLPKRGPSDSIMIPDLDSTMNLADGTESKYFMNIVSSLTRIREFVINGEFNEIRQLLLGYGYPVDVLGYVINKLAFYSHKYEAYLLAKYVLENNLYKIDVAHIITVFNGLVIIEKYHEAIEFFNLTKSYIYPSLVCYSILIKLYSRTHHFDIAENYFEEMKTHNIMPNSFVYSTLIDSYSAAGNFTRPIELINEMKEKNVQITIYTYNSILSGFLHHDPRKIFPLFESIEKSEIEGIELDTITLNIKLNAYFKLGQLDEGIKFFEYCTGKYPHLINASLYNLVISEHCRKKMIKEASSYLTKLLQAGYELDRSTFAPLIHETCAQGQIHEAEVIYDYMKFSRVKPSITILNAMITGYFTSGYVEKATQFHMKFFDEGFKPEKSVFVSLLNELVVQAGNFASYSEFFLNLMNEYETAKRLGYSLWNILIAAYFRRLNDPVTACAVFLKGMDYGFKCSVMTYSLMIPIYGRKEDYNSVAKLYQMAKKDKVDISNADCLENLLLTFAKLENHEEFENILRIMSKKTIYLSRTTVMTMISIFHSQNDVARTEYWQQYLKKHFSGRMRQIPLEFRQESSETAPSHSRNLFETKHDPNTKYPVNQIPEKEKQEKKKFFSNSFQRVLSHMDSSTDTPDNNNTNNNNNFGKKE